MVEVFMISSWVGEDPNGTLGDGGTEYLWALSVFIICDVILQMHLGAHKV